jgi:hypothetical protein
MSLTLRKIPQELQPTYNQVIIVATSSFQTELNYQLVSDIYCRGQFVTRMKTPVNPEGYVVVDLHKHLENRITFDFLPTATNCYVATQSFASYSVNFSNEFRHEWGFIDNFFSVIGGTSYAGFVSLQTPYFNVGDEVYISQAAGFVNPQYNGVHEIIQITQSGLTWSITVDVGFGASTPLNPGTMSYAEYQLTTIPVTSMTIFNGTSSSVTASFPERYVFNGVLSFLDFNDWNYDDWDANTTTLGKFFTNVPQNYELDIDSLMFLNMYQNAANEIKEVKVRTNLGTYSLSNSFTTITNDQHRFLQTNASPKLMAQNGWINDTTTSIDIWVNNQTVTQTIATQSFKISNRCSKYDKMQILFMDKAGSFLPYTFNKVNREIRNITRTDYQQHYGNYAPATNNWSYNSWDRGRKNLDTQVVEQYTLNSDWVNQSTSDYLMELFESPEAFLVKPDGTIVAISITVQSVERKQTINEQVINYVLTFELSNKNMQQRG